MPDRIRTNGTRVALANDGQYYLLYPIKGTPSPGDGVGVNGDGVLEFGAPASLPDPVLTNHAAPEPVYSRTGSQVFVRSI